MSNVPNDFLPQLRKSLNLLGEEEGAKLLQMIWEEKEELRFLSDSLDLSAAFFWPDHSKGVLFWADVDERITAKLQND